MRLSLRLGLASAIATTGVIGFQYPDCVNGPLANNTVCDAKAAPPDRAAALVKALKIEEKLENLVDMSKGAERLGLPPYAWWSEALHGVAASPGVRFNRTEGGRFSYATSFANTITLAAAFDDDLVYKVADKISTEARAFANAGLAGLDYWTPNINPYKDPRWGRGHETPGEDPVRIKGYVKALLAGLEGDDPSIRKVVATCKHYAAYDLERWQGVTRHRFDAVVSLQDLSEYYLPPFQQCARDSKVGSFMCSYNALNGTPACASTYLMDDILRKHWGWTEHNNYITSDCNAVQDFLPGWHNFSTTQTEAQAAAVAYEAGTDTVCEVPGWPPYTDVVGAYNQSLLSEEVIDKALKRLYEGLVRVGYFDAPSVSPYRSIGWEDVNTPEAQELALQSAADGLVLLKNDGTLPLNLEDKAVALIGFWASGANNRGQMLGGYSGFPPYIHSPVDAADMLNLTYHYAPSPLVQENITQEVIDLAVAAAMLPANKSDVILFFGGTDTSIAAEDLDRDSLAWPEIQLAVIEALSALGKPLVIVQLGDQVDDTPLLTDPNISAILFAGYPGQSGGTAVLNAITGASPPAGRLPVTQYPASYAAQVPMTDMSLRPAAAAASDNTTTGANPGRTYRWLPANNTVLPFGHGLHYTQFKVRLGVFPTLNLTTEGLLAGCTTPQPPPNPPTPSKPPPPPTLSDAPNPPTPPNPSDAPKPPTPSNPPTFPNSTAPTPLPSPSTPPPPHHKDLCPFPHPISIWITNTGPRTSDYVALLFARGEFGPKPYPQRTLVGYKRARAIAPGETVAVVVEVVLGDLARVDGRGDRVLFPGRYGLVVDVDGSYDGGEDDGEDGERREVVFEVAGEAVVLDEFPQPRE